KLLLEEQFSFLPLPFKPFEACRIQPDHLKICRFNDVIAVHKRRDPSTPSGQSTPLRPFPKRQERRTGDSHFAIAEGPEGNGTLFGPVTADSPSGHYVGRTKSK
ncbi:MAG: hypothetical protein JXN61_02585, partial [Sedimentisphaerales bacterium]|nr:hypothetical protein [Sedimentisphaerales bacterium]